MIAGQHGLSQINQDFYSLRQLDFDAPEAAFMLVGLSSLCVLGLIAVLAKIYAKSMGKAHVL